VRIGENEEEDGLLTNLCCQNAEQSPIYEKAEDLEDVERNFWGRAW